MLSFPIMRLFDPIGAVTLEQKGLYYSFLAEASRFGEGFLRLYYHTESRSVRVGLFCERGSGISCVGSISARQLGLEEKGVFSVTEEPWLPLTVPLDGGMLPPYALCRREGELIRVIIPDGERLPPEIMAYCCFLEPVNIEGHPCLSLCADRHGWPVVPEIIG